MPSPTSVPSSSRLNIIITGANSGVGLGIATRLLAQLSLPSPPTSLSSSTTIPTQPTDSLSQTYPIILSSPSSPPEPCPFYPNGGVTLILACRSERRALAARDILLRGLDELFRARARAEAKQGKPTDRTQENKFKETLEIVWEELDLSEMSNVKAFNGRIKQRYVGRVQGHFPVVTFPSPSSHKNERKKI